MNRSSYIALVRAGYYSAETRAIMARMRAGGYGVGKRNLREDILAARNARVWQSYWRRVADHPEGTHVAPDGSVWELDRSGQFKLVSQGRVGRSPHVRMGNSADQGGAIATSWASATPTRKSEPGTTPTLTDMAGTHVHRTKITVDRRFKPPRRIVRTTSRRRDGGVKKQRPRPSRPADPDDVARWYELLAAEGMPTVKGSQVFSIYTSPTAKEPVLPMTRTLGPDDDRVFLTVGDHVYLIPGRIVPRLGGMQVASQATYVPYTHRNRRYIVGLVPTDN